MQKQNTQPAHANVREFKPAELAREWGIHPTVMYRRIKSGEVELDGEVTVIRNPHKKRDAIRLAVRAKEAA